MSQNQNPQANKMISVAPSVQMTDLIERKHYSMMVARNYELLRDIILQTQVDIVNEGNRDTVGPTILGIKHISDILLLFKAKGDVLIAKEKREDNRSK